MNMSDTNPSSAVHTGNDDGGIIFQYASQQQRPSPNIPSHLDHIAKCIYKAKRVVVITGAGISVSAGIPDFRSAEGLYNLVQKKYPTAGVKGKDLFDVNLFRDPTSTSLFYTFIGELKSLVDSANPTRTHTFLYDLESSKRLLRCYTQNIDALESRVNGNDIEGNVTTLSHTETVQDANITTSTTIKMETTRSNIKLLTPGEEMSVTHSRVVQLHGCLSTVVCTRCHTKRALEKHVHEVFLEGKWADCPSCESLQATRQAAGKRDLGVGFLRPNIVLYNEHHSDGDRIAQIQSADMRKKPDMLIVMGTSLKIPGVKKLMKEFAKSVKSYKHGLCLFFNLTEAPKEWEGFFDYQVLGPCDDTVDGIWGRVSEMDKAEKIKKEKKERAALDKLKKMGQSSLVTGETGTCAHDGGSGVTRIDSLFPKTKSTNSTASVSKQQKQKQNTIKVIGSTKNVNAKKGTRLNPFVLSSEMETADTIELSSSPITSKLDHFNLLTSSPQIVDDMKENTHLFNSITSEKLQHLIPLSSPTRPLSQSRAKMNSVIASPTKSLSKTMATFMTATSHNSTFSKPSSCEEVLKNENNGDTKMTGVRTRRIKSPAIISSSVASSLTSL